MKNKIIILLFLLFPISGSLFAKQDSVFFYRSGEIIYSEDVSKIDSFTFIPLNYYDVNSALAVYEDLLSHQELSKFAEMLFRTGFNKLINTSTIMAPVNSALEGVDINDMELIRSIVKNHISKTIVKTTQINNGVVNMKMLNNKNLDFSKNNDGYTFDGKQLQEYNIQASGSVIHILKEYAPYKLNLLEYLNTAEGVDSLKTYIKSLSEKNNDLISYLGALGNEDSTYTAILPNNNAWIDAYNRLFPMFYTASDSASIALQIHNTKWYIIRDLFFNRRFSLPLKDSILISTFGKTHKNPNYIFENTIDSTELSNGIFFKVDKLNHLDSAAMKKEIRVEAESSKYRINTHSNIIFFNASHFKNIEISNNAYILCDPTATADASKESVRFSIPDVLPKKYNIYAVFVPGCIQDTTDLRPFKLKFYLDFFNSDGALTISKLIASNKITNPGSITKLEVAQFQFPAYDMVYDPKDEYFPKTGPRVRLKIENAATRSQEADFNRSVFIDCIIFEPVE